MIRIDLMDAVIKPNEENKIYWQYYSIIKIIFIRTF